MYNDNSYKPVNSFQTTMTPNPEKLYTNYSVMKHAETCFCMCSSDAFKFRCRWFGITHYEYMALA